MLNRHKDEQFFQNLVGTVASISTDCTVMDIEGTDTQHLAPIMQVSFSTFRTNLIVVRSSKV